MGEKMDAFGKFFPLPLIVRKTELAASTTLQLETAVGSAISTMPDCETVLVPSKRFVPAKTCAQLFALRSDAYVIAEDLTIALQSGACKPKVIFDSNYETITDMEACCPDGVPSLYECTKLVVKGKIIFDANCRCVGDVILVNTLETRQRVSGILKGTITMPM